MRTVQKDNIKSTTVNFRLKASSLIEVSVAAVLLSLALGFSVQLFEQISRSSHGLMRFRQELQLVAFAEQVKREKNYLNEELITQQGWTLVKKVSYYESNHNLLLLELSLHDEDSKGSKNSPGLTYREIVYEK